jgi:tetratricopeptide (TPR) repeat protein
MDYTQNKLLLRLRQRLAYATLLSRQQDTYSDYKINRNMADDVMLQEAIDALGEGQRVRARDLLTRLLRADQNNPLYWIWMSSLVDTHKERIYCLESALRLDPMNTTAMRGLVLLGARTPQTGPAPAPLVHRKWWSGADEELDGSRGRLAQVISHPAFKVVSFVGVGLVVIALILVGIFGFQNAARQRAGIVRVTLPAWTLAPASSTPSPVATNTPVVRSPTPTFIGPTPLWMFLKATYTPMPVYVSTPHGVSEAYSAGLRAMRRGDYAVMLSFMKQASQVDPNAADIYYYIGEAYRLLEDNQNALQAYQQSVKADANFAPGYLGQARILMLTGPAKDIEANLKQAISLDPNLADAHIAYADYLIQQGQAKTALDELKKAEEAAPFIPLIYAYRAQADLSLGFNSDALQAAQQAYDMDTTLLPAYLALAEAHYAMGNFDKAQILLDTYLKYVTDDLQAWLMAGRIQLTQGNNYQAALDDFTHVLSLDKKYEDAYYYRGETYLAMQQGQKAVNDFAAALQFNQKSFDYNLEFGHALLLADRGLDAYHALQVAEKLALEDQQKASVYYWQALSLEQLGNPTAAIAVWKSLLTLPKQAVSSDWVKTAQAHLLTLNPPTQTQTLTSTYKTPTVTVTPTATPRPTLTSTNTPGIVSRATGTPTPTARATPTRQAFKR